MWASAPWLSREPLAGEGWRSSKTGATEDSDFDDEHGEDYGDDYDDF